MAIERHDQQRQLDYDQAVRRFFVPMRAMVVVVGAQHIADGLIRCRWRFAVAVLVVGIVVMMAVVMVVAVVGRGLRVLGWMRSRFDRRSSRAVRMR